MASFTDNQPVQFNPYIQQLPVDDYIRAGMMKQQQYSEGVQRVQNYVDTIGALPVVGEANKQLLANRMGELRTKIQGIIGKDFSKMGLQMQVGSLAMEVAKDPAIMKSVEAARQIQALEQSINDAKKSGKGYSSENETYARSYVEDYLKASEKTAGLDYKGPTSIHSTTMDDVHKKIRETIAPLKGMEDIDYTITTDGKVQLHSKDKIMDGTRIQAAINAVLTADDLKAMQIDGWYNTRGMSDEHLANLTATQYETIADKAKLMKEYYRDLQLETPGMSDSDKARYDNIAKQHEAYELQYRTAARNTINSIKNGTFNREDLAGRYNEEKTKFAYAGMYQFRQEEKEEKIDPHEEVYLREADLELKRADLLLKQNELDWKKSKEGIGSDEGPSMTIPVTKQGDDDRYAQRFNTAQVQSEISDIQNTLSKGGEGEEKVLKSYAMSLINSKDPDAQDISGLVADPSLPDGYRWKSKADRDRIQKTVVEGIANYSKLALDPNFTGIVPQSSRTMRMAHMENLVIANVQDKLAQMDNAMGQSAVRNNPKLNTQNANLSKTVNIRLSGNSGATENVSVGKILSLASKISNNITNVAGGFSQGFSTSAPDTPEQLSARKELEKYDQKDVQKVLNDYRINLNDLASAKDAIYKTKEAFISPRMRVYNLSNKEMEKGDHNALTAAISMGIKDGSVDNQGNIITKEMMPAGDARMLGAYRDYDGRLKARVAWTYGKDKTPVEADIDIDEAAKSVAGTRSWIGRNFLTDRYPKLTEALRYPGASPQTAFSKENGYAGSLMVTGNDRVARRYMVQYDRASDTYHAIVAIPQKGGGFKTVDIFPDGFVHAGAAIDGIERLYSTVTEKNGIDVIENSILKSLENQ